MMRIHSRSAGRRGATSILRIDMSDVRRILLVKPSSLGDIVHAMPVVAALKGRWPAAHLTWVVKRQWADLVERVEGVDRMWPVEFTVAGWLGQARALRAERFDLMIDLQGLFRSAALGWLSGAPRRVGFLNGREGSPWFYTHRVPVPTADMHAVDRYLLVAAAVGAAHKGVPAFRFTMLERDCSPVRELLRRRGLSWEQPWVAMSVSARWATKRWPLRSFAAVADHLFGEGLPVVVIGNEQDRADLHALKAATRHPIIDVVGALPLGSLPALLSKAAVMVTNDSGPMHVAAAVGTPVVALFGPTSAGRTGPYGAHHTVLTHEVPCRPCFSRVCRHTVHMECLQRLAPEQVLEAVRHGLAQDTFRHPGHATPGGGLERRTDS